MRSVLQRTEAQYALYRNGILDAEIWRLRCAYAKSLMNNPIFMDIWRTEKVNSMFSRAFIAEIDNAEARGGPAFLGVSAVKVEAKEGA